MSEEVTLDEYVEKEDESSNIELGPIEVDIPSQWNSAELSDLFHLISGNNYSGDHLSEEDNGGRIFLTLKSVNKGGGFNQDSLKYYAGPVNQREIVEPGELLIANTDVTQNGDVVGYSIRVPDFDSEREIAASMDLSILRPKANYVNLPYMEYLLQTDSIHSRMRAFSAGSTVLHLNTDLVESLSLPLPPLSEQRKIATVLYTIDRLIEKTEEIETQLERTKLGLVQDLLTQGLSDSERRETETKLGEIPSHWDVATIEEILSDEDNAFTDGARYSLSSAEIYDEGEARAILLEEVGEGEFKDSTPKFATQEKYEEITHRAIYPGEVVVAKMAEPVARACLVPDTYEKYLLGCADVVRIVPNEEVNDRFLMYCMNSYKIWRQAVSHLRGTGRSRINLENIAELKIPVPPLTEQDEIAEILYDFDRKIRTEREYRDQLKRLKQGLMQDLLSGTVRTTDANIEVPDEIAQYG